MKLRIKGNSIRLRVSRSDLTTLAETGSIEGAIHFAENPAAVWRFGVAQNPGSAGPSAAFASNRITVTVSAGEVQRWAKSDEVGIYFSQSIGSQGTLDVLLEKDFACLDGNDDDNSDTFPNPAMECAAR